MILKMKISDMIFKRVNKDYLLPSIQREFVWMKNPLEQKVEKLFDSIMQKYPFGTILAWEVDKPVELDKIHWEVFNFVQHYDKDLPHNTEASIHGYTKLFLVLDGQQRLSSLNLGLRGSFTHKTYSKTRTCRLYLNLFSNIEHDPDNNYSLKYEFKFLEKVPENDDQLWFQVGKVLDSRDDNTELFKELYDKDIRDKTDDNGKIIKAKMILGQLHQTFCCDETLILANVTGDDEKALNVFVRTNDGGIKLEKSDLLLSYMESNKNIFKPNGARREVFGFVDLLNKEGLHKPDYGFAKDDVLKTALVLSDLEVQYKLKNFNKDNLETISNNWEMIKTHIDLTARLIARYGFSSKNIISKNALIPISYYLMKKRVSNSFIASQTKDDLENKNEIIKWLVVSQITGAFGRSSDTTLKSVRDAINRNQTFKEINLGRVIMKEDVEKWISQESYGSKYSHLILLLITKNKYWDECHQDHIFPGSKFSEVEYKDMSLTPSQIRFYEKNKNSIVNLHLLNPAVNIVKSNNNFIDWNAKQNCDFLESALIPSDISLEFRNFEEFFAKRKSKLINHLYKLLSPHGSD
jgi:uncharacterized protein with ParB-like and HNH nuclease domain